MLRAVTSLVFRRNPLILARVPMAKVTFARPPLYTFTSSSDSTQAALLQQVEAKVFQVLKTAAKCNTEKLSRKATFQELGFDSLDGVELVVAMEEYFGFDIPNEQAEKISTVQAAINTFYRHMNAQVANKVVEEDPNTKKE